MTYPLVDLGVAQVMYGQQRPFRIRLVFEGDEDGVWCRRWWLVLYDGTPDGQLTVRWGLQTERGFQGERLEPADRVWNRIPSKQAKGYTFEPGTGREMPPERPIKDLPRPFAEIRELVRAGPDEYRAYTEDGEFLLTLTREGADAMLERDPYRVWLREQ